MGATKRLRCEAAWFPHGFSTEGSRENAAGACEKTQVQQMKRNRKTVALPEAKTWAKQADIYYDCVSQLQYHKDVLSLKDVNIYIYIYTYVRNRFENEKNKSI